MRLPFSHSEPRRNQATLTRMRLNTLPFVVVIVSAAAAGRAFAQAPAPEPGGPLGDQAGRVVCRHVGKLGHGINRRELRGAPAVERVAARLVSERSPDQPGRRADGGAVSCRDSREAAPHRSHLLAATSGLKLERDRLAGLDFRSLLDGGPPTSSSSVRSGRSRASARWSGAMRIGRPGKCWTKPRRRSK